ncbi:MAG: tetratricopeptide repeat protein [Candidatus Lokiarchaeota archaeon]|nr:tetratricopeptide repeat protein [Candidatus Lokiarchaeota archaeon]
MNEKIVKKKEKPEELIQIKRLMEKGRFYEALQTIEVLEKRSSLISHDKLSLLLFKCTCLNRLRLDENALKFAEEAYQKSQKLGTPLQSVDALIEMAETLAWLTIHDEALNLIDRGEDLLKNIIGKSPKELMAREASLTFTKGRIYMNKYDYNLGLKHLKKSLTLVEELDVKQEIARTLIFIGRLHFYLGDYDIAIEYYQRGLGVAEEGGSKHYIPYTSCLIGFAYWFKGEIARALEYGKRSLSLAEEINCKYIIIRSCDLIGLIYNTKGYFDRAIEFWEQQMKVAQEISSKRETIDALHHIGSVYRNKGDLDKALSYMEKSLALYDETVEREAIGIPVINLILYDLFELSIAKGNFDHARLYYQQFDLLPVKGIRHEFSLRLFKAQLLKISKRVHNRSKAEKILKQLIDEEGIDIEYYYIASINLCDLLLFELGVTNDLEVLDELQSYITRLLDIAEKTGSYSILCETYLLQAKLSLLTFDIKKAQRFLTQAQQIAERFGLKLLSIKISNEHDELLKQLNMWENLKESSSSLKERMEFARLNEQVENMIQKRAVEVPELSDEEPVLLLIVSEGGRPIFSKLFVKEQAFEDHLFGGFFTAINSFINEKFSEGLDRATFGEHTLLMNSVSPFLICYVFKGQSYLAQQRIRYFIDKIQNDEDIWQNFKKFYQLNKEIQLKDIPSLEPLINEIFMDKTIPLNPR